ncbi:MAG: alpha-amylase family glycosyl hydrolase [Solirubrobacteraceae bacterium]
MRIPVRPTIYEINTAVWLQRRSRERGGPISLADVAGAEWDRLAALGVDAVWLMGVWQRSPAGRKIALEDPQLVAGYRAALGQLRDEDVLGSPYCVHDYTVDARFGGPEALAQARSQLAARGVALILDYVPNHVAVDHPWGTERPACLLAGSHEELAARPKEFVEVGGRVFAKGRDPYFDPWQDVLQLNAYSRVLRDAAAQTVIAIGYQCDGLRCDMAMLMTNEVFARTWGQRPGPAPEDEFWPTLIGRCREVHPELLFLAEVYWDMEWTMQQQGFDLCYDKRLYDRLRYEGPASVRGHLQADAGYQQRLLRFIENHDEPRAAATFGAEQARAAAVVISTLQGARLYHDGQLDGLRTQLPVQLGRGPDELADAELRAFYDRLLAVVPQVRAGEWRLCECAGAAGEQLLAWCWSAPEARHLVVVNLSAQPGEGSVRLPWEDLAGREWTLTDRLADARYERAGDALAADGLYVALDAWGTHLLAFGER